jgi:hypothetical protein
MKRLPRLWSRPRQLTFKSQLFCEGNSRKGADLLEKRLRKIRDPTGSLFGSAFGTAIELQDRCTASFRTLDMPKRLNYLGNPQSNVDL